MCAFIEKRKIDKIISGKLFDRLDLFKPLIVPGETKPFECVGTKEEVWLALHRCLKKKYKGKVLDFFEKEILPKIKNKIPALERKYNKVYSHHVPIEIWKKVQKFVI